MAILKINTTIMKELLSIMSRLDMIIEETNNGRGQTPDVIAIKKKLVEYVSFVVVNKKLDINTFFASHITYTMLNKYIDLVGASLTETGPLKRVKRSIDNYCTVVLKSVEASIRLNAIYDTVIADRAFDQSTVNSIADILDSAQRGTLKKASHAKDIVADVIEEKVEEKNEIEEARKELDNENASIGLDKVNPKTHTIHTAVSESGKASHIIVEKKDDIVPPVTDMLENKTYGGPELKDDLSKYALKDDSKYKTTVSPVKEHNIDDKAFFDHGIRNIIKAIKDYKVQALGESTPTMITDGFYSETKVVYTKPKFTTPMLANIKRYIRSSSLTPEQIIDLSTMVSVYVKNIGNEDDMFTAEDLRILKDKTFEALALIY